MLGNCATGKLRTVSEPTKTMTMEITMATMGRLMKNFDMDHLSLSIHRSLAHCSLLIDPYSSILGLCCERLGIYVHAGAHSLNPFRYDPVAGIQAARDDPLVTDPGAHGDSSNIDFVVATDDRDLISALEFRHRTLRNKQRPRLGSDYGADFAVTTGPQNIVRIRKKPRNSNCAGALIDLPVGKIKLAFVWIG